MTDLEENKNHEKYDDNFTKILRKNLLSTFDHDDETLALVTFEHLPDTCKHAIDCINTIKEINMDSKDLMACFLGNFVDKEQQLFSDKIEIITDNQVLLKRAMTWLTNQLIVNGYEWTAQNCEIPPDALYSEHNFNNFIENFELSSQSKIKL